MAVRWIIPDLTGDESTLGRVMAECHQALNHYFEKYWPCALVPNIIKMLQWIKCFTITTPTITSYKHITLLWRHNERDGVSNHQPHGCLLSCLFRCRSRKTAKLRVTGLSEGIHRWPVNSPHKGPVTRTMFPFDDVIIKTGSAYHCFRTQPSIVANDD